MCTCTCLNEALYCKYCSMYVYVCDDGRPGAAKGAFVGRRAALEANSTLVEFNMQDNSVCLSLSRPCKSNLSIMLQ